MSPSGLLRQLALMTAVCLLIGIAFACFGAWLILPFAGLEMAALAAAFYRNGRHAGDFERIALSNGRLLLEVREADSTRRRELDRAGARLAEYESGLQYRLVLLAREEEIEIGRHLDAERRRALAAALRTELSG